MDQAFWTAGEEMAGIGPDSSASLALVGQLPPEVQALRPRMRQLAVIVYLSGGATVKEVQAAIPDPPTIFGIRTMLNRLSKKGIVKTRKSGKHSSVLYCPAIITPQVRSLLVRGLLEEHFRGSASGALEFLLQLKAHGQRPTAQ